MNKPLALDPRFRDARLRSLAQFTLSALGVAGKAPDPETILEHSVQQACAELEFVQMALEELDQTSVLISILEGIRHRLELVIDNSDLLAELIAEAQPEPAASSEAVTP